MERLTEYDHLYESYEVREGVSFATAINKLAEYEEAEEQGLIVKLPCKVGDVVYYLWYSPCMHGNTYPDGMDCQGCYDECDLKRAVVSTRMNSIEHILGEWGKFNKGWYFLTEAEALQALKERG